jgi:hypothetical protein
MPITATITATMTKAGNALIWAVCALILSAGNAAQAATAGLGSADHGSANPDSNPSANSNPYQAIVERNVFGLKPIPPPAPPAEPPKPPVNITLTGITTLFGKKRCFVTVMTAPKAGAPAAPESKMLSEGERDGGIEVVSIDEKAGTVNLKDGDSAVTVSFDKNGVKGGPPPMANAAGMGNTHPGYQPSPFTPTPGQKMIPGRPLRIPTPGNPGSNSGEQGMNPAGGSTSTMPPQNSPQFTVNQQTPQMSPEETELMIAAQHQQALSKNDGSAALYPPTALDPTRNVVDQNGMPINGTGAGNPNQRNTSPNQMPLPGRGRRPF